MSSKHVLCPECGHFYAVCTCDPRYDPEREALRAELKARGFYWKWNPETGQATCYKIRTGDTYGTDALDDPALD